MAIGIDIGSKTIKAVELSMSGKPTLKSAGIIGVNSNGIEHFQDEKEYIFIADAVKKLFNDAKFSTKEVSIALPESQVFTRILKFPLLSDPEVASAVKWQVEDVLPIPAKEAIIQHIVLERRENTTPPEVIVLLVATPRALVEKYVKVLTMAGLTVVGAETELMALSRSLAPDNQTSLIIDFGAKSTDIAIAKNAQLVFSRSIPTAGEAFTRAVAQALGVEMKQAEEYKRTYGLSSTQLEGKVGNALLPVFKVVADEIKKAINFYQTDQKGETPSSVIMSGGTAGLPDAAPVLAKLVGVEVGIANPFTKITIDPVKAKNLASYAPLYSVAVGLALRGD